MASNGLHSAASSRSCSGDELLATPQWFRQETRIHGV